MANTEKHQSNPARPPQREPLTDFHTHVLPAMDDGSAGPEQSLELLRQSAEQGVVTVAATPHFYADEENPASFLRRRDASRRVLDAAMAGQNGLPRLVMGAEVHYFEGMSRAAELPLLRIEGTRCILVELPVARWTERMLGELRGIRENTGLTPIVAHLDRYMLLLRDRRLPEQLAGLPVLVQANASFFLHRSGLRSAMRLLSAGGVQLLGSDCHDPAERRPNLGDAADAIEKNGGAEALRRIAGLSVRILAGEEPYGD